MKKLILFISLLLPLSLFLSGCGSEKAAKNTNSQKDQLSIYTTVYPLQYFTEEIGGKFVDVKTIYPPGADEHTFEPTQKDMMNLADADLFFYIGLGLEGFVTKAEKTLKNESVTLIPTAKNIHFEQNEHTEHKDDETGHDGHDHGDINPHVWLDPVYSKELAQSIEEALIKKMPAHKKEFTANYKKLTEKLDQLNKDFETTIKASKQKEIIVAHAAYGYWEERYGIEQVSISGLSTTNEPSQKELEKIIAQAKQKNIKYILFEQNVSSKLTKIVQSELGAKSLTLHNLSVLTDKDIKNNETYFSLMKKNLDTLQTVLNK